VNGNAAVETNTTSKASQVEKSKKCLSLGTQTSGEQWPPQPYEHLFLAVFPSQQPDEVALARDNIYCPSTLLDHFIEISVRQHDGDHIEAKKVRIQGTVI
jgi:hypothetical protein